MKTAASHEPAKAKADASAAVKSVPSPQQAPEAPVLNSVWRRLATHGNHPGAGTAAEPPPPTGPLFVQRRCDACARDESSVLALGGQPKLSVGACNDPYEREADAVADQVMRMQAAPGPQPGRPSITPLTSRSNTRPAPIRRDCASRVAEGPVQRKCEACVKEDEEAQRQADGPAQSSINVEHAITKLRRDGGQALPSSVRGYMEPRFGRDFSGVRVHTGTDAANTARALNANAFTLSRDLVFGAGAYQPNSTGGRRLLAHELTHVVQQGGGGRLIQRGYFEDALGAGGDLLRGAADVGGNLIEGGADLAGDAARGGLELAGDLTGIDALGDAGRAIDTGLDVAGRAGNQLVSGAGEAIESGFDALGAAADAGVALAGDLLAAGADWVRDKVRAALTWLASAAGAALVVLVRMLGGTLVITRGGILVTFPRVCPIPPLTHKPKLKPHSETFANIPLPGLPIGTVALTGDLSLVGTLKPMLELQIGPFCLEGVRILVNPGSGTYAVNGAISAALAASLGGELRIGLRGEARLKGFVIVEGIPIPIDIPLLALEGGGAGILRGIGAGRLTSGAGVGLSGGALTLSRSTLLELGLAADAYLGMYLQLELGGKHICRLYWDRESWHGGIGVFGLMQDALTIAGGRSPSVTLSSSLSVGSFPFADLDVALSRGGFRDVCPIKDRLCKVLKYLELFPSNPRNGGAWDWSGSGRGSDPMGPGSPLPGPLRVFEMDPGIASGSQCRGACGINCNTCEAEDVHFMLDDLGQVWMYLDLQDCPTHSGCREHDAGFDWAARDKGEVGWGLFDMIRPWHMAANMECLCSNNALNCPSWALGGPPHDEQRLLFAETSLMGPFPPGSEEEQELLVWCDAGRLPPDFCEALYQEIRERFGDEHRDPNLDPDEDIFRGGQRPDDAPISDEFRRLHNRFESMGTYIRVNHRAWVPEYEATDCVGATRQIIGDVKLRTKQYKREFRNLSRTDADRMRQRFLDDLRVWERQIDDCNHQVAAWYRGKTGSSESLDEIIERLHVEGTELWRELWLAAVLAVNRILARLWPPAKTRLENFVTARRAAHPGEDFSGSVGELTYIGSLARGYKGPPKQHIRFNPELFDVDANLDAPPLSKYAMFANPTLVPDRGRLFGRNTPIPPLISFADTTEAELTQVDGYDTDPADPFDVVLETQPLPEQDRHSAATERIYRLREELPQPRYDTMLGELRAGGFLTGPPDAVHVRDPLSETDLHAMNAIMDRYEP